MLVKHNWKRIVKGALKSKITLWIPASPQALTGSDVAVPRWRQCVADVTGAMGLAVGRMYVEEHFTKETKDDVSCYQPDVHYPVQCLTQLTNSVLFAAMPRTVVPSEFENLFFS